MKLTATNGNSPVRKGDKVCVMQNGYVFELIVTQARPATSAERFASAVPIPLKLQLWLNTPND